MSRPEHIAPPDVFYNEEEAKKYAANSRMIEIQSAMSERAIELMNLPEHPCHVLDIGCGSGLSGEVLSEHQHVWVGCDISDSMLSVAVSREVEGDLFLSDMGQGLYFRPGTFDACISISALQWLCNADKKSHIPQKRLSRFFQTLYNCMKRGARAVFQLYPETPQQMELITAAAMRSGFGGGVVVDFPNSSKAKKIFLVLFAGIPPQQCQIPQGKTGEEDISNGETVRFSGADIGLKDHSSYRKSKKKRRFVKDRNWVLNKKDTRRRQGKQTAADSKYTSRRRRPRF